MAKNDVYLGDFEKYVLLAIQKKGNNAYGIEIANYLEESIGKSISFPAVYTTLERLKKKGLVSSKKGGTNSLRQGKAKLYFQVTGAGQIALKNSKEHLFSLGFQFAYGVCGHG